jgi:glycosyltransferase involved in cell wall biosynthesis
VRTALLANYLSPAAGGLAASVPGMADALSSAPETEVHILGARDPFSPTAWSTWGAHVHPHAQYGLKSFHWTPGLPNTLERLRPDLTDVQGLWTYISLANWRFHKRTSTPYVITPRGMLDPWARRRSSWKKRIVISWFERAHLAGATCFRVTSPMEARHLRDYGLRRPLAIVPNGVEIPPNQARAPRGDAPRRLLFLSRIHPKKGIAYLLRSWDTLHKRYPEWELAIVGPDEVGHTAQMQRYAADMELPRVLWLDAAEGPKKLSLYRDSDLFVLPTHAENFGLVVAEALAAGLPVVTTTNAPWEGLRTNGCGWWVELDDTSLTSALDHAMSLSDAERLEKGARGRQWMKRDFSWASVGRELNGVYRWILGGGPPPACVVTD